MDALPLFSAIGPDGSRRGYEPAVAQLVSDELGRTLEWVALEWADFYPGDRRGSG